MQHLKWATDINNTSNHEKIRAITFLSCLYVLIITILGKWSKHIVFIMHNVSDPNQWCLRGAAFTSLKNTETLTLKTS